MRRVDIMRALVSNLKAHYDRHDWGDNGSKAAATFRPSSTSRL